MKRIGIIGCGKIAQVRHIPELNANPDAQIVGYYNPTHSRAEKMAAKYGGKVYDSIDELLADESIDAVVISLANVAHAEASIQALQSGKAVLCEKPMATTLEECEAMVAASVKANKPLMIAQNQRLTKAHELARQLVAEGRIGRVVSFRTTFGHENCPMLFDQTQWPGGQNLMTTPVIWKKVFEILPYDNLGINYDPSHFIWQMIDYIEPLYEFKDKIFHVHCKDIKLDVEKLHRCGIMAYPLDYMHPKLPGLGDVNWGRYISALTDIGYDSFTCIEVEDRAFEGSREKVLDSLRLSKRYMEQYVI